ncbi:MAG TPA: adenylate/guanylate cyclase domain-containing protein [Gaiellaceae bacterium]|nr:adenylate/guanylate cyclase domain-containing protein [Gaiellaceae bacterium]
MTPVRGELPSGTVTFLFTDVERSTQLLHELGADAYAEALAEHRRLLRHAFTAHGGVEVDTQGDAFFIAFRTPAEAVAAAREAVAALASGRIRVRVGIHTGTARLMHEGYVGEDVHKGARIAAAGHGGQVLLSRETRDRIDDEVIDLGEHRLKDFAEPVWIFQLGSERFPPLRTISNTNLPRPASSFVGRERELEDVISLLQGGTRLLTLTGPGGSGKTRLALEAAAKLVPEFKAGVFWVGLAPLRDPALVPETVAQTLGAKDGLAAHIGERELLLLLDNLEQVVEAAPELAQLVESCPNLRLLVTSRALLRVRGEVEYAVPPLAEPEAVELFCDRTQIEADATIAELCRRLDNLPLAVELAAARARVLSPAQILERLSQRLDLLKGGRDTEARQQTLRAAIEWSYELLSPEEQALFGRLAVFAGGCSLDASEEVAAADLEVLQSLVEKSLVRRTEERFWMLETIREYASERLAASGEADELRRRHAEHFLALAEEAEPHLRGSPGDWAQRLEREHDNLRGALEWFASSGDTQDALRLAGALWRFWYQSGYLSEGRRRLESAVAADDQPTTARAKALHGAAAMAVELGDTAAARRWLEEALSLYRQLGDDWGLANSGFLFANLVWAEGDLATARQLFDESVPRFREAGDEHYALLAEFCIGWMTYLLGDRARAKGVFEELLPRTRAAANTRVEALTLAKSAMVAADEGRVEDALTMLKESLHIDRASRDLRHSVLTLSIYARTLAVQGRAATAAQVLAAAQALGEEIGIASEPWLAEMNEMTRTMLRDELDEPAFVDVWEEGRKLTADEAVALALRELESDPSRAVLPPTGSGA